MSEPDLKKRTKAFALRILKLVDALPKTTSGRALAAQLVRSGTSVAANYRAARRANPLRTADELVAIIVASINTAKRKTEVGSRKSEAPSKRVPLPTSRFRLPTS